MDAADVFKTCSCCSTAWKTRNEFLSDPYLKLNGYQICMVDLEYGLFLFTHLVEGCFSTIAINIFAFSDLYDGLKYRENRALSPECPRYCIDEQNLERCESLCECAYVREIMQIIKAKRPLQPKLLTE